jgi:hypothetical protein
VSLSPVEWTRSLLFSVNMVLKYAILLYIIVHGVHFSQIILNEKVIDMLCITDKLISTFTMWKSFYESGSVIIAIECTMIPFVIQAI